MTPKEKAEELVKRMRFDTGTILMTHSAKGFAIIAAEETSKGIAEQTGAHPYLNNYEYWKEVIEEIKLL